MSTMKCRCGSDEKISYVDGKMIRETDGKAHICLDEIDKIPIYKKTITELQKMNLGLLEHNNYLQTKIKTSD